MKMLTNKNKKSSSYSTSYLGVSSSSSSSTSTSNSSASKPNTSSSNVSSSALSELEQRLKDYGLFKYDGNGRHAKVVNVFPNAIYGETVGTHSLSIIGASDEWAASYKDNIKIEPFGKIANNEVVEQFVSLTEKLGKNEAGELDSNYKYYVLTINPNILKIPGITTYGTNGNSILISFSNLESGFVSADDGTIIYTAQAIPTASPVPFSLAADTETETKDGIIFEYKYKSENFFDVKMTFDENVISVSPTKLANISGKNVEIHYSIDDQILYHGETINEIHGGHEFLIDTTSKRYLVKFLNNLTKPIGE